MMRIPKATAPGIAPLLAAGTIAARAPEAAAAPAAATLVVNANTSLRPVTHVASGALYGQSANGTPADLANVSSGLNLETQNAGTTADTLVDQATVTGANDQQWEFAAAGNGECKIANVSGG